MGKAYVFEIKDTVLSEMTEIQKMLKTKELTSLVKEELKYIYQFFKRMEDDGLFKIKISNENIKPSVYYNKANIVIPVENIIERQISDRYEKENMKDLVPIFNSKVSIDRYGSKTYPYRILKMLLKSFAMVEVKDKFPVELIESVVVINMADLIGEDSSTKYDNINLNIETKSNDFVIAELKLKDFRSYTECKKYQQIFKDCTQINNLSFTGMTSDKQANDMGKLFEKLYISKPRYGRWSSYNSINDKINNFREKLIGLNTIQEVDKIMLDIKEIIYIVNEKYNATPVARNKVVDTIYNFLIKPRNLEDKLYSLELDTTPLDEALEARKKRLEEKRLKEEGQNE